MPGYRGPLVETRVIGGEQFRRLAAQMRDAGRRDLVNELRKSFRAAARPVVADVQRAYRMLPEVSPAARQGPQARATIAKAVRLRVSAAKTRAGVTFIVDARRLPAEMRPLPKSFESRRGWRHPVYGRADRTREQWAWVHQEMPPPFRRTVGGHDQDFKAACLEAMERIARQLT